MTQDQLFQLFKAAAIVSAPGGLFHYGRTPEHGLQYDGVMPQVHCDPFYDSYNPDTGMDSVQVLIGFFDQDTPDTNGEEQRLIVSRMEKVSRRFLNILSDTDELGPIRVTRKPVYRYSQALLTGITCAFEVSMNVGCDGYDDNVDWNNVIIVDGEGNNLGSAPEGSTIVIESGFRFGVRVVTK